MKIIGTEQEVCELLDALPNAVKFDNPMWSRNLIEWHQKHGDVAKFRGHEVYIEFIDNHKVED